MRHPHVLQLIMDSLRYWVTEMHVDGFRFDLAATLARQFHEVDRLSAFFDLVQQDPVVSQVKLIAEPWDVGEGGYQVGNFPPLWTEWNGKYRDTVRDFWRGEPSTLAEFASRLTGSSDLYQDDGRRPLASINFVTAHDGFTLRDLVSYNEKHNEANGEDNSDGESHNRSWNCGAEGRPATRPCWRCGPSSSATSSPPCCCPRACRCSPTATSSRRTQNGNNNVYCQDNELSWLDWKLDPEQIDLLAFTQRMVSLRRDHPVFRRRRFFHGEAYQGGQTRSATSPGSPRRVDDDPGRLANGYARAIAVFLNGQRLSNPARAASACSTTRSWWCSTPITRTSSSPSRRRVTAPGGRS